MEEVNSTDDMSTSNKLLCLLLFGGILFQYADRNSVAVVLVDLQMPPDNNTNTNISKSQIQYSQFQVGMILSSVYIGQLPSSFIGGYLAYRYSAIRVFLASFGVSSIVHVLAPVMFGNFETAVIHRVLAGLAEGVCEPATYGVLSQYLTPKQSARVSPFIFAAFYFGQFSGILATGFITQRLTWQTAFYVFGGLGIAWNAISVGFAVKCLGKRQNAQETPTQNKGDIEKMKSIPFCHIFTSTAVWAYSLLQSVAYVFEPTLLPLYFHQSFGVKIELAGVLAGSPILIFGFLEPAFALFGNILCKYVSTTVVRKAMAVIGCLCVSGCFFVVAFTSSSLVAGCFVAIGFGTSAARAAVADANPFDIAPRYASVLTGINRVFARVVGLTFPLLVAALTKNKSRQEWSRVVLIKAFVFAATAIFYGVFGSGEEQPWAVVISHGEKGAIQDGEIQGDDSKECKVNDEKRRLIIK